MVQLNNIYKHSISVSTEMFDWVFLYLLVGKVGGTKNEFEVQEFKTPFLISIFITMKLYSGFWGPWATASMCRYFLPMVYANHLTNL